jgi:hypothetical protein
MTSDKSPIYRPVEQSHRPTSPQHFDYYVDSKQGSDSNPGRSVLKPFRTLTPVVGKKLRWGIGIACGSEVLADGFIPKRSNDGDGSAAGGGGEGMLVFGSYGSGPPPILKNSQAVTAGTWTNVSGTIYSTPSASTYYGTLIWWDAAAGLGIEGQVKALKKGTAGSLTINQWALASGNLQVNIGRAPTTSDVFEVPQNTNSLFNVDGSSSIQLQNLSLRYSGSSAVEIALTTASDNVRLIDCELAYANGGLIHCGAGAAATNIVADGCYFHDQYNLQNAFAHHADVAAGSSSVANCTFRRLAGFGIAAHDTVTQRVYNNLFDGARILIIGTGAGSPATHTFIKNQQCNQAPDAVASDFFFLIHSSPPCNAATVVNLYNHSVAAGTMPVQQRCFFHGSGALTIKNFAWYGGFSIALRGDNVNGSRANNNIAGSVFGNELYYWYRSGSSGILDGSGDVGYGTTDPYTNVAIGDLRPRGGSPLLAAGVTISGVTTGTPPDIGYTGAA